MLSAASNDKQKITLVTGNYLVAHRECSTAPGKNEAFISGIRLLQIHSNRAEQFQLQATKLDGCGEIGLASTGNGHVCGVVNQLKRISEGHLKRLFLTVAIGCSGESNQNLGAHLITNWRSVTSEIVQKWRGQ